MMRASPFPIDWSYDVLSSAGEALGTKLEALRDEVLSHVIRTEEPWRCFAEAVAELRRVGHDLWSWDRGGDSELWGKDYMRAAPGQEIRYQPVVEVGLGFGSLSLELDEQD